MPTIDVSHLLRCTQALEFLGQAPPESVQHELYRSACVKEFEIILELGGKLLKKALGPYYASPQSVNKLIFKDIFRAAGQRSILPTVEVERWLGYRDHRNKTAHDYGAGFADATVALLPQFAADAHALVAALRDRPLS